MEGLAFDLHAWFKCPPCKEEDFRELSDSTTIEDESLFLCHVDTRWLTLCLVLERIVERLGDAKEYFLKCSQRRKSTRNHCQKQSLSAHCQGIKGRSYNTCWNQISDWCCTTVQHLPTNFQLGGTSCALLAWGNDYTTLSIGRAMYQRRWDKWMQN